MAMCCGDVRNGCGWVGDVYGGFVLTGKRERWVRLRFCVFGWCLEHV